MNNKSLSQSKVRSFDFDNNHFTSYKLQPINHICIFGSNLLNIKVEYKGNTALLTRQWRNEAPGAPATPEGAVIRGHP